MYFCGDCKKQFQGGRRIDSTTLWQSYLTEKRTVKELSVMHKCSERTIRRKLKLVAESFTPSFPKEATVIIDTTYFSRTFGVMLFQDATSGKLLYRKFVKNETNKEYLSGLEDIKDTRVRDKKIFRKVPIALISLRVPAVPPAYCQRNNRL